MMASQTATKYHMYPTLRLYDQLHIPYVVGPYNAAGGALWTGDVMILDSSDTYEDSGFFHELTHWLIASPRQRTLPDFGLGRWIGSNADTLFTSSATPHLYIGNDQASRSQRGWGEHCISPRRAQQQEELACAAGALYFVLTGEHTIEDRPDENNVPFIWFDFFGHLDQARPTTALIRRIWTTVVAPLNPTITLEQTAGYLRHIWTYARI
jgi:hypothetical protein